MTIPRTPPKVQKTAKLSGGVVGHENRDANAERPLIVLFDPLYNPKWDCDPSKFDVDHFFKEASITDANSKVLRGRFDKFCTQGDDGSVHLTKEDFSRFNLHYKICASEDEEQYFRVMDRNGFGQLSFQDFLIGCSAANPTTPHILNSYTGYMRARYLFDFYNTSRSGALSFEELARLLLDTKQHLSEPADKHRHHIVEVAQELGEVSVVTARITGTSGASGSLCEFRASTKWVGKAIKREIARHLQVPVEGLEILVGHRPLDAGVVLEDVIPAGAKTVQMTLASANWDSRPTVVEPNLSDSLAGLERLVHITFDSFYQALTSEQLRGTSRLFRFRKQILQLSEAQRSKSKTRKITAIGGA